MLRSVWYNASLFDNFCDVFLYSGLKLQSVPLKSWLLNSFLRSLATSLNVSEGGSRSVQKAEQAGEAAGDC